MEKLVCLLCGEQIGKAAEKIEAIRRQLGGVMVAWAKGQWLMLSPDLYPFLSVQHTTHRFTALQSELTAFLCPCLSSRSPFACFPQSGLQSHCTSSPKSVTSAQPLNLFLINRVSVFLLFLFSCPESHFHHLRL